jgi:hypothetical protein
MYVCMYIYMVVVGKKTKIALGIHRFTLSATTHVKEIGRGRPNNTLHTAELVYAGSTNGNGNGSSSSVAV